MYCRRQPRFSSYAAPRKPPRLLLHTQRLKRLASTLRASNASISCFRSSNSRALIQARRPEQTASPQLLHRLITAGTSTHIAHCLAKPCVPQALRFERFGNCTSVHMIRPRCCTSHASNDFLRELQFGAPQQTRRQAQPASLQLP